MINYREKYIKDLRKYCKEVLNKKIDQFFLKAMIGDKK